MIDNPQAFPYVRDKVLQENSGHPIRCKDAPQEVYAGMTLRDYFAIHADSNEVHLFAKDYLRKYDVPTMTMDKARYLYADAMLKARKNK